MEDHPTGSLGYRGPVDGNADGADNDGETAQDDRIAWTSSRLVAIEIVVANLSKFLRQLCLEVSYDGLITIPTALYTEKASATRIARIQT